MTTKVLEIILIIIGGYYFTHRFIPFLFVRTGRLFGFKMKFNPIWQKRIRRFKSIKRGYYSYILITTAFVLSLFLEFFINNRPLYIKYENKTAFPAPTEWLDKVLFFKKINCFNKKSDFGQIGEDEVDYRLFAKMVENPEMILESLKKKEQEMNELQDELADTPVPDEYSTEDEIQDYNDLKYLISDVQKEIDAMRKSYRAFKENRVKIIMPVYPYSPHEHLLDMPGRPPHKPGLSHPMGTDDSGTDVLAVLFYGFRISLSFALFVAVIGYFFGTIVGAVMGFFGGWTDIIIQRFIEVWSSIPFLFTIMIIASVVQPNFIMLVLLLVLLRSWIGITYYIRGEFYREKAKDYVQAAVAIGARNWTVMMKHILPNSLVPVVTFAPFGIVSYIGLLVSLDYLGFGLPVGTPSWGALLDQGMKYIKYYPHLIFIPSVAFALTLFMVVMIGEAVREAFDPKVFSRLR